MSSFNFLLFLSSGQWRLGGVSLTIICSCESPMEDTDEKESQYSGFHYDFDVEDILLGEGSDVSMVELRPRLVTAFSGLDSFALSSRNIPQSASLASQGISNEESMREYADLKFSLLLYDTTLIFVGTQIASLSAGEKAGFAFLTGGVGGLLYLLLLQRSVDGLPSSELNPINRGGIFGRYKGPLSSVALAVAFVILAVKYSSGDIPLALTPRELVVGMMGFLVCKVAVLLAAFKPMAIGLKENK